MVRRFWLGGKPFANQESRLAEDGEILVRGPNVTPRYANNGNDTRFANGFLMTGDIGRVDRRNRLYILGRKKEVIVTGEGFNVHASDIEAALNSSPGVQDSVVVGLERQGHMHVHAFYCWRMKAMLLMWLRKPIAACSAISASRTGRSGRSLIFPDRRS